MEYESLKQAEEAYESGSIGINELSEYTSAYGQGEIPLTLPGSGGGSGGDGGGSAGAGGGQDSIPGDTRVVDENFPDVVELSTAQRGTGTINVVVPPISFEVSVDPSKDGQFPTPGAFDPSIEFSVFLRRGETIRKIGDAEGFFNELGSLDLMEFSVVTDDDSSQIIGQVKDNGSIDGIAKSGTAEVVFGKGNRWDGITSEYYWKEIELTGGYPPEDPITIGSIQALGRDYGAELSFTALSQLAWGKDVSLNIKIENAETGTVLSSRTVTENIPGAVEYTEQNEVEFTYRLEFNRSPGDSYRVYVGVEGGDEASNTIGEFVPYYDVELGNVDNAPLEGESLEIPVTVTNTGTSEGVGNITLSGGGQVAEKEVALRASDSQRVVFRVTSSQGSSKGVEYTISSPDESVSVTVNPERREPVDPGGGSDDGSGSGSDNGGSGPGNGGLIGGRPPSDGGDDDGTGGGDPSEDQSSGLPISTIGIVSAGAAAGYYILSDKKDD